MTTREKENHDGAPLMAASTPQSRGVESLIDHLRDEAARIHTLSVQLREARRCRNLLVKKAQTAGLSLRHIEAASGVSNVRLSQIVRNR